MNKVKSYLEDQLSILKFDLDFTMQEFYESKEIVAFHLPSKIIEAVKESIIEDGIKDEVEINSIGHKYLYKAFKKKHDESTEYFYYRMMVSLAFCEFYFERNNLIEVIRHLNSFHFFNGINTSKNNIKIQKLQRIDDGRKKGQIDSIKAQKIIKELLITRVWDSRGQFYLYAQEEVEKYKVTRSLKSIEKDFHLVKNQIENYNQYFKHKGKK
ncbi:hypothetical protein OHV71_00925 [Acinetobacter baumannii]|nr:hypothetical protein [Acinetobacter baumannii]